MSQLLTIGYTEPDAQARIDAFLDKPNTLLVDIRFNPQSRYRPRFGHRALMDQYGARYLHCRELGNENYRNADAPIKIWKPEEGVGQVMGLLQVRYSLMLMCACKDYEACHRKVVYELIMAEMSKVAQA